MIPQLPLSMWEEMRPVFLRAWPREAVVAVWGNDWLELYNVHTAPALAFELSERDRLTLIARPPTLFLHSHPNGSPEPSDADTQQQIATGWAWGIVAVRGSQAGEVYEAAYPECWGPGIPAPPLLGRTFLWGVRDCWTLCRDYYAERGVHLPSVPRARDPMIYPQGHWGRDQFMSAPKTLELKEVARHDRRPGDVCRWKYRGDRYNHCAIYLGEGQFLHQPEDRTSEVHITADEERLIERFSIEFFRPRGKRDRA